MPETQFSRPKCNLDTNPISLHKSQPPLRTPTLALCLTQDSSPETLLGDWGIGGLGGWGAGGPGGVRAGWGCRSDSSPAIFTCALDGGGEQGACHHGVGAQPQRAPGWVLCSSLAAGSDHPGAPALGPTSYHTPRGSWAWPQPHVQQAPRVSGSLGGTPQAAPPCSGLGGRMLRETGATGPHVGPILTGPHVSNAVRRSKAQRGPPALLPSRTGSGSVLVGGSLGRLSPGPTFMKHLLCAGGGDAGPCRGRLVPQVRAGPGQGCCIRGVRLARARQGGTGREWGARATNALGRGAHVLQVGC